jgi:hypothetical protein
MVISVFDLFSPTRSRLRSVSAEICRRYIAKWRASSCRARSNRSSSTAGDEFGLCCVRPTRTVLTTCSGSTPPAFTITRVARGRHRTAGRFSAAVLWLPLRPCQS